MKQQKPYEEGSVLMDAPHHNDMDELAELAQDRQSWRATKHAIGSSKQCSTPHSSQYVVSRYTVLLVRGSCAIKTHSAESVMPQASCSEAVAYVIFCNKLVF